MKKQFLSIIAAGLMLGGVSQIKAMEAFLAVQTAAAVASQTLYKQQLPHFPDKIISTPHWTEDKDYVPENTLPFKGGLSKCTQDNDLIKRMKCTPKALVLLGVRDQKFGYCIYGGKMNDGKMDLMKFIPSEEPAYNFWNVKAQDLHPQIEELVDSTLKELETNAIKIAASKNERSEMEVLNWLGKQRTAINMRENGDTIAIHINKPTQEWIIWDRNKIQPHLLNRHGVINPDDEGQQSIEILLSHPKLIIKRSPVSQINISESANEYRDRLAKEREELLRADVIAIGDQK